MCLNAWPIGGGIISRCGLVGGSALLVTDFEVSGAQARLYGSIVFLLPANLDVELSLLLQHLCLCSSMLPTMMRMD